MRKEPVPLETSLPAPTTAPTAAPSACGRRVEALQAWTRKLKTEGPALSIIPEGVELLEVEERANGAVNGPTLHLTRHQLLLDGRLVGHAKQLRGVTAVPELVNALQKLQKRAKALELPLDESRIRLLVNADVPWRMVAALPHSLSRAGADTIILSFRGRTELATPIGTAAAYFERLARPPDPAARAVRWGADAERPAIFERCPEVKERLAEGPEKAGGSLWGIDLFVRRVPEGLRACDCRADFDDVRAWLWAVMDRFSGPPTWSLALKIAPSGSGASVATVTLPAATTWEKASRALLKMRDADAVALKSVP